MIAAAAGGGQFQVVVGNEVPEVFAAMGAISKFGGSGEAEAPAEDADKGNLFNRFIKMISAIFSPLIWALAATGLLKAFVAAAAQFGWLDTETSTYVVLYALSDAFINFLPMGLAITAARYFNANQFTALAMAGALVYPSIIKLNGVEGLTFFGIPMVMVSYVSSVIPIVIMVWLRVLDGEVPLQVVARCNTSLHDPNDHSPRPCSSDIPLAIGPVFPSFLAPSRMVLAGCSQ